MDNGHLLVRYAIVAAIVVSGAVVGVATLLAWVF